VGRTYNPPTPIRNRDTPEALIVIGRALYYKLERLPEGSLMSREHLVDEISDIRRKLAKLGYRNVELSSPKEI
jgi:hypothetical protein